MKRIAVALLLLALVAGAGTIAWRSWSGHRSALVEFSGYVDADYVMVTSTIGGTLVELHVERGDRVAAGDRLFALDQVNERGQRDEAAAKLEQAKAQYTDLLTGRRPSEIDQILAQRVEAEAALHQSETELQRQIQLHATKTSSTKQLDDARAQRDRDRAHLDEMDALLEVARLPGREDQIKAAEAAVTAAQAALAQADWKLAQKTGMAPAAGVVVDTLYRPGEMVSAGMPVVQLLPPANLKIRFFVPEAMVAQIAVGDGVRVSCDGCEAPVAATVRFISPQAEFTPPVIYSREQRARLVFMVEARPDGDTHALRVGQPVDVTRVAP